MTPPLRPDQLPAKWREGAAAMTAEADEENKRRYLRDEQRITYCRAKADERKARADELEAALSAAPPQTALVEDFITHEIAPHGISWNPPEDVKGLWDWDGEPRNDHPWIQGQVLMRKMCADTLRTKLLPKLLALSCAAEIAADEPVAPREAETPQNQYGQTGATDDGPECERDTLEMWRTAALLKDRTRRALRERITAGERHMDIADDFRVPLAFVSHLGAWQLFGYEEQAQPSALPPSAEQEKK